MHVLKFSGLSGVDNSLDTLMLGDIQVKILYRCVLYTGKYG